MYCTNCGNKLKENTNFCTRCGERIKQNTSQNTIKEKKPELPEKEIEMIKDQQKRTSKPKENIQLTFMVIIIFLLCLTSIFIISLATNTNKKAARVEPSTKEVIKDSPKEISIKSIKLFDNEYMLGDTLSKYLSTNWELNPNYASIDTETATINDIPSNQLTLKNKTYEDAEITVYLSKKSPETIKLKECEVVGLKVNWYKSTKEVYFELDNLKFKDDVKKVLENFSKPEENNIYKPAQSSNTIYNYTSDEHELLLAINNNNELVGFKYMEKEEFYK